MNKLTIGIVGLAVAGIAGLIIAGSSPSTPEQLAQIRAASEQRLADAKAASEQRAAELAAQAEQQKAERAARAFNRQNIHKIVEVSRNNELLFDRDYKNQPFIDALPFNKAVQPFGFGKYQVYFGADFDGVLCFVSDAAKLKEITDWPRGLRVHIDGTIRTTSFGDVQLDDCTLNQ